MGTRGAFGFRVDDKDYIGYNQFDSYPGGKGQEVLEWLRSLTPQERELLPDRVRALKLITDGMVPTAADIAHLHPKYSDLEVSRGDTSDWYCLTRTTHGDLRATLECGYMLDSHEFLEDSLFCEYAYVVNLDAGILEVYKGFNKVPGRPGRYTDSRDRLTAHVVNKLEGNDGYYPVALWESFPLDKLPKDLEAALPEEDSDEEPSGLPAKPKRKAAKKKPTSKKRVKNQKKRKAAKKRA